METWDVSQVTSMSSMFYEASAFYRPLEAWGFSQVTYMRSMLSSVTAFNQHLRQWGNKLSAVVSISNAFAGTDCNYADDLSFANEPTGPFCTWCVAAVLFLSRLCLASLLCACCRFSASFAYAHF